MTPKETARSGRSLSNSYEYYFGKRMPVVTTEYVAGPGQFAWTAVDSEYGGPPDPVGTGATEAEAIADLREKSGEA